DEEGWAEDGLIVSSLRRCRAICFPCIEGDQKSIGMVAAELVDGDHAGAGPEPRGSGGEQPRLGGASLGDRSTGRLTAIEEHLIRAGRLHRDYAGCVIGAVEEGIGVLQREAMSSGECRACFVGWGRHEARPFSEAQMIIPSI